MIKPQRCRGFSLIEVLVCLGVISFLLSLLLPGVQKIRGSSQRLQCVHRLRQIGIALHNYHDVFRALPAGTDDRRSRDGLNATYRSWPVALLPFIEQAGIASRAENEFQLRQRGFQFHEHFSTSLPAFSCPADSRTLTAQIPKQHGFPVGLLSFQGCSGLDFRSQDGVLFAGSAIRFSDVTDGLSTTLFVVERPPSADLEFGWWYGGAGQDGSGSIDAHLGVNEWNLYYPHCEPGPYSMRAGNPYDDCAAFHIWSLHGEGANVLMCDGSARFQVPPDLRIQRQMGTRSGGDF